MFTKQETISRLQEILALQEQIKNMEAKISHYEDQYASTYRREDLTPPPVPTDRAKIIKPDLVSKIDPFASNAVRKVELEYDKRISQLKDDRFFSLFFLIAAAIVLPIVCILTAIYAFEDGGINGFLFTLFALSLCGLIFFVVQILLYIMKVAKYKSFKREFVEEYRQWLEEYRKWHETCLQIHAEGEKKGKQRAKRLEEAKRALEQQLEEKIEGFLPSKYLGAVESFIYSLQYGRADTLQEAIANYESNLAIEREKDNERARKCEEARERCDVCIRRGRCSIEGTETAYNCTAFVPRSRS